MRSIRRSMTGYLFVLLALTLAVVWGVIDQVTARTLASREEAGADLIRARYEERCREYKDHTNKELLDQAVVLGNIMQLRYREQFWTEVGHFNRLNEAAPLMFLTNPMVEATWTLTANYNPPPFNRPNPGPALLYRMYFANLPLPDEFLQEFAEKSRGSDYFQVNTLSGREWHSKSLGKRRFEFNPKEIDDKDREGKPAEPGRPEGTNLIDWVYKEQVLKTENDPPLKDDNEHSPKEEAVWRVLYKVPYYSTSQYGGFRPGGGRGPGGPPGPPPPRSMIGAYAWWAGGEFRAPMPPQLQGVPLPPSRSPPRSPTRSRNCTSSADGRRR